MFKKPHALALLLAATLFLVLTNESYAIPTWIGVTGATLRQTGGNPGTFTIMMNQNYATLHASVGLSVNGGDWKEYPMVFAGPSSKNLWKWTYTPTAVFPASASVNYYFRGWDDAGGALFDGSTAASYAFAAVAPPLIQVAGDVDIQGEMFTLGSWLDNLDQAGLGVFYSDNGSASSVRFAATRAANDWLWQRGASDPGGTAPMMQLDALNRLSLFNPATANRSVIVLDPSGAAPGILIDGQRVLTAGFAATSYLPLLPLRLTVGVNNVAGTNSFAAGESNDASGRNATALGSGAAALGENSAAMGDHTVAQGAGQIVAGTFNALEGEPSAALFVIGNGTSESNRSNALTVMRNGDLNVSGDAKVAGNLKVTGALSIPPQGDLSMGEFTQGAAP